MRSSPLYQWLTDKLREDILQGTYKPGDALPTEHELMREFNLSSTTVRRAVNDLAREGWIYRKAGKGTFVKRDKLEERLIRLTSFAEEMQSHNLNPQFKLVQAEMVTPPHEAAQALRLPEGEPAYLIERIQIANGEPIALAVGYWLPAIGARLAECDLNEIHLYETVERTMHLSLAEADESISAVASDREAARHLNIPYRSPLLLRTRITYTTEMRPVEFTLTYYRADRYEYKIRLARHS